MKSNKYYLLLVLLLFTVMMCACTGGEQPATTATDTATATATATTTEVAYDPDAVIVYAIYSGWKTMVPFHWSTSGYTGSLVWDKIYDKLVTVHADGTYTARAAKTWEQSADKKVITFHLDPNCKWQDGQAVTAKDWEWTAQTLSNKDFVTTDGPKLCALFAGTDDKGVEVSAGSVGVKALDDYTLEITFKNPIGLDTFFNTYNLYFSVLPKHCFDGVEVAKIQENAYFQNPIGSGPMKIESMSADAEITFVPNPDYQLGAPQFGKLVMRVMSPANYASAFMAGEIDFCYSFVGIDEAYDLAEQPNLNMVKYDKPTSMTFMFVNHEMIPDVRVRKAMNMLIDKQMIVDQLFKGEAVATESVEIPGTELFNTDLKSERNVAEAKKLLDEAGWDYNTEIKVVTMSSREKIALIIQQNWAEAGLKMSLETVDAGTMFGGLYKGTYAMGVGGGLASPDPLYQNTNFDYRAFTIYRIKDQTYVDMANAIATATDHADYVKKVWDYQQYMYDNMTLIPICFAYDYGVTSKRLTNIVPEDAYRTNDLVWEWKVLAQ